MSTAIDFRKKQKEQAKEPFEFIDRTGYKYTLKNFNDINKKVLIKSDYSDNEFIYNLLEYGMSEKDFDTFDEADITIGEVNEIFEAWAEHSGIDLKKSRRR